MIPRLALSLRQPWAWLVTKGGKPLENRRWDTSFRGDFLIHASKGMTNLEYHEAMEFAVSVVGTEILRTFPSRGLLERGGIVGRARLVDVVPPCVNECSHPWHMPDQWGFRLANITPLPFVPCKGMLGFFKVDDETYRALLAQDEAFSLDWRG